ncbi:unnamed protein product [marine sediment metagenome]|uniref:Uncharacterized protein n=1 Tax=marine sediment metagenome TaxID=412755 RepID=X1EBG3_9ZZZZ
MGTDLPPDTDWIDPDETYDCLFYQGYCTPGEPPENDWDTMLDWHRLSGQYILDWMNRGYNMSCEYNGAPYRRGYIEITLFE